MSMFKHCRPCCFFAHPPTWKGLFWPPGKHSPHWWGHSPPLLLTSKYHSVILRIPCLSLPFTMCTQQEPHSQPPIGKGLEPLAQTQHCACRDERVEQASRCGPLFFCVVEAPPLLFSPHSPCTHSATLPRPPMDLILTLHLRFSAHPRLCRRALRKTGSYVSTTFSCAWEIQFPP